MQTCDERDKSTQRQYTHTHMTCTKHKSIKPIKHYTEGTKSEQFYRGQRSYQQSASTYTALKISSAETE